MGFLRYSSLRIETQTLAGRQVRRMPEFLRSNTPWKEVLVQQGFIPGRSHSIVVVLHVLLRCTARS